MAKVNIKQLIEDRLLVLNRMRCIFPTGPSVDELRSKHLKFSIRKIESGEEFDTHECIVVIVSDEEIVPYVTTRGVTQSLKQLEQPYGTKGRFILKILKQEKTYSADRKQVNFVFHIINNLER